MALNNYANLKASIINWSHRNDVNNEIIDDFIDICETEMYKDSEDGSAGLVVRGMETRATASASTRFLALPTQDISGNSVTFLKMRKLKITSGGRDYDVRYKSPEAMEVNASNGRPRYFTITSQIEFDRVPDSTYTVEMNYYATAVSLDDTNTTNTILTNFPTIYLYGGLYALFQWAHNADKAEYWYIKFRNAITSANKRDRRGRLGPAPAMQKEGSTP